MKSVASLTLGLCTGLLLTVACVDDNRPVAALPSYAGETSDGGEMGANGGRTPQGGEGDEGGSLNGAAGQSEMGGAGPAAGAAGANTAGQGQAGETAEAAPIADSYGAIYAALAPGVDTRFPELGGAGPTARSAAATLSC